MDGLSTTDKLESIKSFQSTISKTENALSTMMENGTNTTLIKKRLNALRIGLDVIENVWDQRPHHHTKEAMIDARNVLNGLLPSIESFYKKAKEGSPQKTLLDRRIKSLELAIEAIEKLPSD